MSDSTPEEYYDAPATADPVVRRIILIAFGLVIVFLSLVVSLLFFGLLEPSSPRTSTERSLTVYSALVESGEANASVYPAYARELIGAGRYARADEVIEAALAAKGSLKAQLLVEKARLAIARHRYPDAVTTADEAIALFEAQWASLEKQSKERGLSLTQDRPVEHRYALILKAEALLKSGDDDAAVASYDEYLKMWPVDADVLALRGDAHAETGDTKAAEKDYRAALKLVPAYEPAIKGLDEIGASR